MKIDRMLSIVVLLLSKKKVTAKELAELFEVSERTIYRDIDTIDLAGIPIVTQQGTGGGISIMRGFTMDRQAVSVSELSSIVTALQIAGGLGSDQQYALVRKKLESVVSEQQRQQLKRMHEGVAVDVVPWGFGPDFKERLAQIQQTIADCRVVGFTYLSSTSEALERECEPHKLIYKGYNWYLYGYCLLRGAFRIFKLSRIRDFVVRNRTFVARDIAGYQEQLERSFNRASQESIQMVLSFAAEARMRLEEFFGEQDIQRHQDGHYTVQLKFPENDWLYSFVLSFGDLVTVVEPPHLREIIRRKAQVLVDRHS